MDPDELLRLAASVEQMSPNVVGSAIVQAARARSLALGVPEAVVEGPGMGVEGRVEGRLVVAGSARWLAQRHCEGLEGAPADGGQGRVLVSVDGRVAGHLSLSDVVRDDAAGAIDLLRAAGVVDVTILSGDGRAATEGIGRLLGVDAVHADLSPQDKLSLVRAAQARAAGGTVVMVGDGINDAPALAAADVGVAMAGGEATVSSQAADVVIAADRIVRVAEAVAIGRRSLGIARQSVIVGISLSGAAMLAAAWGYIPPVAGALLQEVIDVAVILNALRALRG
jgi:cation transport ATPase